jgi:hypothetical protein
MKPKAQRTTEMGSPDGSEPSALTPKQLRTMADEEAMLLEQAMRCAETGSATHWPTVAGYLRDEVLRLRARLETTLRVSEFQVGDIVCWRGDRWFEGRIVGETAPEHKYLDTEVWDLEVTNPGTRYADVDMTGRPVHVSEEALVLVRRDGAMSTTSPSAASTKESP